jgi:large subunit ribosomal protein L30
MIAIIRIRGQVGLDRKIVETLNRLKLRKKYSCVVLDKPTKEQVGMIQKVRNFVAYGEIDKKTYEELVKKRGGHIENFFRLHPPRKGIDSKKHFGVDKGVLGDNKEKINDLIQRML